MGFVVRGNLLTVWGVGAIGIEVRSNIARHCVNVRFLDANSPPEVTGMGHDQPVEPSL